MEDIDQPTLSILTGISFAGKSVLAKRLAMIWNIPQIDPDAVGREIGFGLNGEFLSHEIWATIHQRAEQRACAHLHAGRSVVYDTTSFTRDQRDELRELATRCNARSRLIFVDTPRSIAFERWRRNEQTNERFRVHADDFAMVADAFEIPEDDEDAVRFRLDDDLDRWITLLGGQH